MCFFSNLIYFNGLEHAWLVQLITIEVGSNHPSYHMAVVISWGFNPFETPYVHMKYRGFRQISLKTYHWMVLERNFIPRLTSFFLTNHKDDESFC